MKVKHIFPPPPPTPWKVGVCLTPVVAIPLAGRCSLATFMYIPPTWTQRHGSVTWSLSSDHL